MRRVDEEAALYLGQSTFDEVDALIGRGINVGHIGLESTKLDRLSGGEAFETAKELGLRIADKLMGPVEDALFGGCKGLLHGVRDALEDTSL